MRNKGFTLIELMMVLAIIAFGAALIFPMMNGQPISNIKFTPTGIVSEQCLSGYKFVVDANGNARQVLDEFGKGVKC